MRAALLAAVLVGAAGLPAHRHHSRPSGHESGAHHPVAPTVLLDDELKEQLVRLKKFALLKSSARDLEREEKTEEAEEVEREVTIVSEHANCPDAQCPRAKVYNVGYIGKGYNLIYGNPYPKNAGIDSGFTKFGGAAIFQITYDQGRETVDGREEVPDDIVVMAEHGCTLQMTMSEAKDSEEYEEMIKTSKSYEGSVNLKFVSGAGKFSSATKDYTKKSATSHVVKTYSEAMCDSFRIKLNKYSGLPKFTGDFKMMVTNVVNKADQKEKAEAFYDLFDSFGTHYLTGLTLGSKFVLNQNFELTKWDSLVENGKSYEQSAELGLTIPTKKKKAAKKKKRIKGCPPDPDGKKNEEKRDKNPCESSTMDWVKETFGLLLNRMAKLEASAGTSSTGEEEETTEAGETDEAESREIISIGAPPSDDALEWAQQSVAEAMPIKYSLAPLCYLFNTVDADLLVVRKQSQELLGDMDTNTSDAFMNACMRAMQTGYCPDRVSPREGGLQCEGKMSQRASHTCSKDGDCNAGGTHYECVKKVCRLPYTRVVDLKLVGVASDETMPACPDDYTAVKLGTDNGAEAARLGCPSGDDTCTHHSQLCMLKKPSTTNVEIPPVCQLFLANDKPQISKGMGMLENEVSATGRELRSWWPSGDWERSFAKKVLFEDCAGCETQSGWVGQGDGVPALPGGDPSAGSNSLHKYLWTESKTCEAYYEPLACEGFMEFDTCDLSAYPRHEDSRGYAQRSPRSANLLKCDTGDNKIDTNRMGFCVCSPMPAVDKVEKDVSGVGDNGGSCTCPRSGEVYQVGDYEDNCDTMACHGGVRGECGVVNPGGAKVKVTCGERLDEDKKDMYSNPFFCGHPSTLNCYDYCRSSNIAPAITDIVASDTRQCPDTYEAIRMNGDGNSNLYAASPVNIGMYLCIQRMLPESTEGQTHVGDGTDGEGEDGPQALTTTLEKTRRSKPDNDHRVERAIEHFVERSEAPDANGDMHLQRQAAKAGGLARVGGALAGALEASRPHKHVLNAVRESVATPGSIVHPTKGSVKTEKDNREQAGLEALEELESALLGDASLLQVTEERADSTLTDPNVNAVLGMGAIASEPKSKVTVKSQSALCPDDQCPRQKVVNLGYIAKGYNLLYGNPHPEGSGVDPGFTNYGGSDIFKLMYNGDDPKQTADGRYDVPTALDVVSEHGCSLSFSSESESSVYDYHKMEMGSTSHSAGLNAGPFVKVSYKGSKEFKKNSKELNSGTKTIVNSEARCSAFSARLSRDPEQRAAFSGDFLKAVEYLEAKEADKGVQSKEEAWYDFFDTFGTHFISWMVLGSRYTMQQIFDKSSYEALTTNTARNKVTGDIAMDGVGVGGEYKQEEESSTDKERNAANSEDKRDRTITALGAPPAEDELKWAKQSKMEAMPVDMSIEDICDLFGKADLTTASYPKTGNQELKTTCNSLLTFSKYCKQRVAPRSGVDVCDAVQPMRKSHTCVKDSDCGNAAAAGEKSFECVDGVCILAYTRIFDMHLAFQTPCPTNDLIVNGEKFEYQQMCDGEPVCEAGYEKVQKVDKSGSALGVANLNEYLDGKLSADQLLDTYTTHLCVRKVSTTLGGGFPSFKDVLPDYGNHKLGEGFPVCQAFLSKASVRDGSGYSRYWVNIGQECGNEDYGFISSSECDQRWTWLNQERGTSDTWKNTHDQLSRVQGVVGCLQRGPGAINQKYVTRGLLNHHQYLNEGTYHARYHAISQGGISDVNLHNVRCYEARADEGEYQSTGSTTWKLGAEVVFVNRGDGATTLALGSNAAEHDSYTGQYTHDALSRGHLVHECGRFSSEALTNGRPGGQDELDANGGVEFYKKSSRWSGDTWAVHCPGPVPPKHLWFQSGTCEKAAEPMTCVSFTQVDCNSHQKKIEVFQCDNNNQEGKIAADQAGFCTCKDTEGNEIKQKEYFMCNAHPPTSCQEYCLGKDPQPGVTDMVMVSSADQSGAEPECPDGYERVRSINKGNGNIMTALSDDLNEGRNRSSWPILFLCQTFKLTSKMAAPAVNMAEQTP